MEIRDFLFALLLVKNLGIVGRTKVWHFLCQYPGTELPLTIQQLRSITGQGNLGPIPGQAEIDSYHDWQRITIFDDDYTPLLREVYYPPLVLFYIGNLELLKKPTLSIVGTRMMSDYAERLVKLWVPKIAESKVSIVSGLALGVDEAVHRATLRVNGNTIGVIGTGLDIEYPQRQDRLQRLVGQQGLLLSEYLPGTSPRKHHFPERNRIIAGLATATLVVEAKRRSGSLITANAALEANREVLAIPGRVDASGSAGTNQLIAEGATPVNNVQDILRSLRLL